MPPLPPQDPEGGTRRSRGGGASLPLLDVGKGFPIQFIVDSRSQKNLISVEVVKQLGLLTTTHPQPYTIGWLHQGRDLHVSQQCLPSIQHQALHG
jgi:hypothetical protein